MPLSDRLKQGAPPRNIKGPPCRVGVTLQNLTDSDAAALREMLADDAWTAPSIMSALREEGHHVSDTAIGRHRRNECSCELRGLR